MKTVKARRMRVFLAFINFKKIGIIGLLIKDSYFTKDSSKSISCREKSVFSFLTYLQKYQQNK